MIPLHLSSIVRYTPHFLQNYVGDTGQVPFPSVEKIHGAVLFCDIAGFSTMAEKLTFNNPDGIFELTSILDIYIGNLVKIISTCGGDVVKFAGDALFAVWRTDEKKDITAVTHLATECAFIIKKNLNNMEINHVVLNLRIGLGAGALSIYQVGGLYNRRELLFVGDAMNQASNVGSLSKAKDFYISREVYSILTSLGSLKPAVQKNAFYFKPLIYFKGHLETPKLHITPEAEKTLRAYLPRVILSRIDEGLDPHAAEIREVSVIFLKVTNFVFSENVAMEDIQDIMKLLQECLYEYEGSINRFGFDDKGAVLLAAFGLPPMLHTDDPARAVHAAIYLQKKFRDVGKKCHIGIGTGNVFCGSVGSETRSEYTMHGTVVNNTAGLMQASKSILCDQLTYEKSRDQIEFKPAIPLKVKGRKDPIPVYEPVY